MQVLKRHSILVKNFGYLSVVQIFNTILFPIITYPVLIKALGIENYGLVVFAQNFVSYFTVFVNYGFNISAVRDIAQNSENIQQKSEIVSSVFAIKLLFALLSLILLIAITLIIPMFREFFWIYLFSSTIWLSEIFFPIWYFQGTENMKHITLVNIFSKIIVLVLLMQFIKHQNDTIYVPIIYGVGALFSAVYSIYLLKAKEKIRFYLVGKQLIIKHTREGSAFFISGLAALIKDRSNLLFIGILFGMKDAGVYDIANKLVNLFLSMLFNISNAVFPYLSKKQNPRFSKRIVLSTLIVCILAYLLLLLLGGKVLNFLGIGADIEYGKQVMQILGLSITLAPLSALIGSILLANGYSSFLPKNLVLATIVYFTTIGIGFLISTPTLFWFANAIVISVLVELLHRVWYCYNYKLERWLF